MEIIDREQRLGGGGGGRRRLVHAQQHVAADHHPRQLLLGRALAVDCVNSLASPQHRDPIRDLEDLVELVRDEDHGDTLVGQRLQDLEELVRLLGGQHGRGLVQDQDVRAPVQGLEDLDPLLLPDGDRLHTGGGIDGEVERPREVGHPLVRSAVVEQDARLRRLRREHDVLRDCHHGNQHEVLMHHADPVLDRVFRRMQPNGLSLDEDLALIRLVQAVEDVHQR